LEELAEALCCIGFSSIGGARIKNILNEVYDKYRNLSLDHLHEEANCELMEFDGVGKNCILYITILLKKRCIDSRYARGMHN
jgi:endonuclease III-like uncharacterized protein